MNFVQENQYAREDLLSCGEGQLFGEGNGRLPTPNMLMFDRISSIKDTGGEFNKGKIVAELDIDKNLWFFDCHFKSDPVMPGCLGLDAMWQLIGFYLCWLGHPGKGRALGAENIKFSGQVLPTSKKVIYEIDMKRVLSQKLTLGLGNGTLFVDGKKIYSAKNLKVGLFKDTSHF
tara:strand:+ start:100 stop:621 length:522 start_codon:yes stop_codon:yes gene_type:complete